MRRFQFTCKAVYVKKNDALFLKRRTDESDPRDGDFFACSVDVVRRRQRN